MIKKYIQIMSIGILLLFLSACGSTKGRTDVTNVTQPASGETAPAGTQAVTTEVPSVSIEDKDLPLAMELVLGSFKLEETDYPIDAEQAGILLPLWKAARSLSNSETTASQEITAVLEQIQSTLTAEQLQSIDSMKINFEDMHTIAETFDIDLGTGGFGNMDPSMKATMEAARSNGQAPPGGFEAGVPGMGDSMPGGEMNLSPEARQTAIAETGGSPGASLGLNPSLLDAIIEFLEAKL